MAMTREQEALYRKTMLEARKQLEGFDRELQRELRKIREHLDQLQESKNPFNRFYAAAAALLGISVEEETHAGENTILPKK